MRRSNTLSARQGSLLRAEQMRLSYYRPCNMTSLLFASYLPAPASAYSAYAAAYISRPDVMRLARAFVVVFRAVSPHGHALVHVHFRLFLCRGKAAC